MYELLLFSRYQQESLANAKVPRQQCTYEGP